MWLNQENINNVVSLWLNQENNNGISTLFNQENINYVLSAWKHLLYLRKMVSVFRVGNFCM